MPSLDRIDVSEWPYMLDEPGGASSKHWRFNPLDELPWLFKSVRIHENGMRSTSDLSEVIACRVAQAIGLPTATYELAKLGSVEGSVSKDLALRGFELDEGWKWIRSHHGTLMPSMLRGTQDEPVKPAADYSYENLHACLTSLAPPPGFDDAVDGYTLFCGYLLLDAIVANTDRHEANWGIFRAPQGSESRDMLAPTFDHGASLGQQLPESRKQALLAAPNGIADWCRRGMARQFALDPDGRPRSLVEYFVQASRLADPAAVQGWLSAVGSNLTSPRIELIVQDLAGLSEVPVTFATKVVEENVRRVLDEFT